jgi:hypothetical protein
MQQYGVIEAGLGISQLDLMAFRNLVRDVRLYASISYFFLPQNDRSRNYTIAINHY